MEKKILTNGSLLCALFAGVCTMQASKVEEFMKERRERHLVEKDLGIGLGDPFSVEDYCGPCAKVARQYKEYLEQENKVKKGRLTQSVVPTVFTEQDIETILSCISKYKHVYSSINVENLQEEQKGRLTKSVNKLNDWQNEIYAYKAAVEADKQANNK